VALHLKPATELAERVLLPADPHLALALAQHLLDGPLMFNHARGLWGYTGAAADGHALTVQATGIGGPSAAVVTEELIGLGARRLVHLGTCRALDGELRLEAVVAASAVVVGDGASAALGAGEAVLPDAALLDGLVDAGALPGTVASTDLFYDPREAAPAAWRERGASAVGLELAAVLQVAARRGAAAAAVLAVTEDGRGRLDREQVESAALRLGDAGFAALATTR
jgi:purine-nucleoside phosphorylase